MNQSITFTHLLTIVVGHALTKNPLFVYKNMLIAFGNKSVASSRWLLFVWSRWDIYIDKYFLPHQKPGGECFFNNSCIKKNRDG